jgi:hypothetical protein
MVVYYPYHFYPLALLRVVFVRSEGLNHLLCIRKSCFIFLFCFVFTIRNNVIKCNLKMYHQFQNLSWNVI